MAHAPLDLKSNWALVKEAAQAWVDDYAPSMGAAISYYTLFSIAPLLLIVIAVAGLVFGPDAARGEIMLQLRGLMGDEGAKAVQSLLEAANKGSQSAAITGVGAIFLLIGATTVFNELQNALDRIWRAPALKHGGVWTLLRSRLLSFGMVMGVGFLLMVSLVISAGLSALGRWWGPLFENWELLGHAIDFVIGFAMTTVVFAMIYKVMPRVRIRWHDVWIGAAVTALLFTIGKLLIGLYIGKSSITSVFGAAGSLAVVLVWVYYSAQIFLMGAEFTWVYAHTFGSLKNRQVTDPPTVPRRENTPSTPTGREPQPAK